MNANHILLVSSINIVSSRIFMQVALHKSTMSPQCWAPLQTRLEFSALQLFTCFGPTGGTARQLKTITEHMTDYSLLSNHGSGWHAA